MPQLSLGRTSSATRITITLAIVCVTAPLLGADHWRQWGGPNTNFKLDTPPLADKWPAEGPPKLWERKLGDGYSAIAYDEGLLYTLYRKGEKEVVVALDATSGELRWSHEYEAKLPKKMLKMYGVGPRAMPMVAGRHLYTVGVNGTFFCFDKKNGRVVWSHELVEELGGTALPFGYSASPVAYKNTIIAVVGGKGQALVAFDPKSGSIVWKNQDFRAAHATPLLINVDGEDQLVAFMAKEVIGVSPADGELKWRVEHENQWGTNCSTPVWGPDNYLFVSTEQFGSRVIKLTRKGPKTTAEEVWQKRNPQVVFHNVIRIGDFLYGACGHKVAPLTAIDIKTGEVAWKDRSFIKPMCIYANDKMILLDEEGQLGLASVTPDGLTVHSTCRPLKKNAWNPPTMVGTKIFIRDQESIVALELGAK